MRVIVLIHYMAMSDIVQLYWSSSFLSEHLLSIYDKVRQLQCLVRPCLHISNDGEEEQVKHNICEPRGNGRKLMFFCQKHMTRFNRLSMSLVWSSGKVVDAMLTPSGAQDLRLKTFSFSLTVNLKKIDKYPKKLTAFDVERLA